MAHGLLRLDGVGTIVTGTFYCKKSDMSFSAIESLEALDFKWNISTDLIRQRAVERERSREASQNAHREVAHTPMPCRARLICPTSVDTSSSDASQCSACETTINAHCHL
jgi:hypothetical protein